MVSVRTAQLLILRRSRPLLDPSGRISVSLGSSRWLGVRWTSDGSRPRRNIDCEVWIERHDPQDPGTTLNWPKGFEPENSRVHARNEIAIAASPERVWRWLIRAMNWPGWYDNSSDIRFLSY